MKLRYNRSNLKQKVFILLIVLSKSSFIQVAKSHPLAPPFFISSNQSASTVCNGKVCHGQIDKRSIVPINDKIDLADYRPNLSQNTDEKNNYNFIRTDDDIKTSNVIVAEADEEGHAADPHDSGFWIKIIVILLLVTIGGLFAGLTIGLMSLDNNMIEVLKHSDDPEKRYHAAKIEPVRRNGHLLLCTLLLGNTIINESLPIIFDQVFSGGVLAVAVSTILILIFGEIIPQAACSKYGLKVGSSFAW